MKYQKSVTTLSISATDAIRTASKKQFRKQLKQREIYLAIKLLTRLQAFQKKSTKEPHSEELSNEGYI